MPDVDIIEGTLKLSFPAGWHAIKLDDAPWYRQDMKSHVKAVDIVAVSGANHWWIEIKDCEGYEEDNRPRLSPADPAAMTSARDLLKQHDLEKEVSIKRKKPFIVDEIFEKFTGSMMCMIAAQRAMPASPNATALKPFFAAAMNGSTLNIALLLTWQQPEFNRLANLLSTKLQQRMNAFSINCFVVNDAQPLPMQPWRAVRN